MYTISGTKINGMYAFYTPTTSMSLTPITSGGTLANACTNAVNAGGGVIRIHNISNVASGGSYRFIGNTADNNIEFVAGIPFSAGVCIKAIGIANLNPAINVYDNVTKTVCANYASDTIFSYGELTANNVVPANGAVILICEVN